MRIKAFTSLRIQEVSLIFARVNVEKMLCFLRGINEKYDGQRLFTQRERNDEQDHKHSFLKKILLKN